MASKQRYSTFASFLTAIGGTFSRASTATYTNSSGLLATASSGAARFDYDPVALTPKGLLLEGARTNQVIQSNGPFNDTVIWSLDSGTTTAAATTSPDGTIDAASLTIANGQTTITAQGLTNLSLSGVYTISAYFKAGTATTGLLIPFKDGSNFVVATFNISAGSVTSTTITGSAYSSASSTITSVGNGWFRATTTFSAAATTTTKSWYRISGTAGQLAYLYGAQLEAGSFASSYIPTTSASVTRATDALTLPFAVSSTMTVVASATMSGFVSGGRLVGIGSGGLINQSDSTHAQTSNGTNSITAVVSAWTSAQKVGVSGNGSGRAISVNGGAATTDANALLSGAITNLYPMADNGSNQSYGDLATLAAWNALSVSGSALSGLTT